VLPMCQRDYGNCRPKCKACGDPVLDGVRAGNATYHAEHLNCSHCGLNLVRSAVQCPAKVVLLVSMTPVVRSLS
jgi:phosphopantetheinyl transferase